MRLTYQLGEYEEAFNILAQQRDWQRAEQMCIAHAESGSSVFLKLLNVMIKTLVPPDSDNVPLSILEYLGRHPQQLDPVSVLQALPPTLPLNAIWRYLANVIILGDFRVFDAFLQSMQHHLHELRTNQVTKNLLKIGNLNVNSLLAFSNSIQAKVELIDHTTKHVQITSQRVCPVCQKPIGDKVFAFYPNGKIVHFKCFKDPSVCPVTGVNFAKTQFQ
jgi:hypothetical protein